MPPLDPLGHAQTPFHVHLTGFGPFREHSTNPSWETVRPLDGTIMTAPPDGRTGVADEDGSPHRPIHFTSTLLPVKYASVLALVPALQADAILRPDLVIHCGVSGHDRAIRLERRARKWRYDSPDADGQLVAAAPDGRRGFVGGRWEDFPSEMRTRVEVDKVCEWVKRQGVAHLSPSDDAGLYLCEFSFYTSLASASLRDPENPTPVLFVHIPPADHPYSVEELTAAMRLIVWAIANEGGLLS